MDHGYQNLHIEPLNTVQMFFFNFLKLSNSRLKNGNITSSIRNIPPTELLTF